MDRYFDTFFYMWKKDNELKEKVKIQKAFVSIILQHL